MQWHAEYKHQSNVTLSEHFSCLDWQVISEDKLHFDLAFTRHNKKQRRREAVKKGEKARERHEKRNTRHISNIIAPVSCYQTVRLQMILTSSCVELCMAKLNVNTAF